MKTLIMGALLLAGCANEITIEGAGGAGGEGSTDASVSTSSASSNVSASASSGRAVEKACVEPSDCPVNGGCLIKPHTPGHCIAPSLHGTCAPDGDCHDDGLVCALYNGLPICVGVGE